MPFTWEIPVEDSFNGERNSKMKQIDEKFIFCGVYGKRTHSPNN